MRNYISSNYTDHEKPVSKIDLVAATETWLELKGDQCIPAIKFPKFLHKAIFVLRGLTGLNFSAEALTHELFGVLQKSSEIKDMEGLEPYKLLILIYYSRNFAPEMLGDLDSILRKRFSKKNSDELVKEKKDQFGFLYYHWAAMYMSYRDFTQLTALYQNVLTQECPINVTIPGVGVAHVTRAAAKCGGSMLFPAHVATYFENYDALSIIHDSENTLDQNAHWCPWEKPIHIAVKLQEAKLMIFLYARGASLEPVCILAQNEAGISDWQALYGNEDTLRITLAARAIKIGALTLNEDTIRKAAGDNTFAQPEAPHFDALYRVDLRWEFKMAKQASRFANLGQLKLLLEFMPWLKDSVDDVGYNLLNFAIFSQDEATIDFLFSQGVNSHNVVNGGFNPMEQALLVYSPNKPLADFIFYRNKQARISEHSAAYLRGHHNEMATLLWLLTRSFLMMLP